MKRIPLLLTGNMVEYVDSSQNTAWHFTSKEELEQCRAYTNYRARQFLHQRAQQQQQQQQHQATDTTAADIIGSTAAHEVVPDSHRSQNESTTITTLERNEEPPIWSSVTTTVINSLPISCYVCNKEERANVTKDTSVNYLDMGPWSSGSNSTLVPSNAKPNTNNRYITPQQEMILIDFYGSKISSMIGPNAELKRLRRESKVVATAAILYRRFYLSNSVLFYDPKIIMVAATFLACKIEDVTCDIRYMEEGTQRLNAPVTIHEIVTGEIILLSGIHYNLLCYHPYKSTLALTEDLRTFLKTSVGQQAFTFGSGNGNGSGSGSILSGQDLKPMYDQARTLLDLIIVSDVPLLYSPGQVGIAALTVAHNEIMKTKQLHQRNDNHDPIPDDILCRVYLPSRFPNVDHTSLELLPNTIVCIADEIRILQKQHEHITSNVEQYMTDLKAVHKQLKKVRIWGGADSTKATDKKKSKKRAAASTPQPLESTSMADSNLVGEPPKKRIKME